MSEANPYTTLAIRQNTYERIIERKPEEDRGRGSGGKTNDRIIQNALDALEELEQESDD